MASFLECKCTRKKNPWLFCEKHLSYAFYAFVWVKTLIVLLCLVLIACLIIDVLFLIVAVSSSCFPSTCSELCSTHWSLGQTRGEFYYYDLFKLAKCPLSQSWQSWCNNIMLYDGSYESNVLYLVLISMCDLLLECATL